MIPIRSAEYSAACAGHSSRARSTYGTRTVQISSWRCQCAGRPYRTPKIVRSEGRGALHLRDRLSGSLLASRRKHQDCAWTSQSSGRRRTSASQTAAALSPSERR